MAPPVAAISTLRLWAVEGSQAVGTASSVVAATPRKSQAVETTLSPAAVAAPVASAAAVHVLWLLPHFDHGIETSSLKRQDCRARCAVGAGAA